jgi:hypothetical protein
MKDKRTRILVIATISVGGLFLLDRGVSALIVDPWSQTTKDIAKANAEIQKANTDLSHKDQVIRDWNKIKDRLDLPRPPDVHTNFLSHLGDLFQKSSVAFDVSENPQHQQQGDFKEYIFDTKFKLTWPQLVDVLVELHNSKEFLKPLRINIVSQYEKEDRLDVDLKVSTIEYSPAPPPRTVPR